MKGSQRQCDYVDTNEGETERRPWSKTKDTTEISLVSVLGSFEGRPGGKPRLPTSLIAGGFESCLCLVVRGPQLGAIPVIPSNVQYKLDLEFEGQGYNNLKFQKIFMNRTSGD